MEYNKSIKLPIAIVKKDNFLYMRLFLKQEKKN